jgi:hypothetical protein
MTYDPGDFDRNDRILLGSCAGIWLAALGAGVAATVALVDMGGGRPETSGEPGTPWLLYVVIGVSALVILGAVPLLLRARREAQSETPVPARETARPGPGRPQPAARGVEAPTEKMRISGTPVGRFNSGPGYAAPWTHSPSLPAAVVKAVDQVWLRCALVITGAIGVAMITIGVATYLMAVDSDGAAWIFYVLTGLVTLAMPAVPVLYLRELRAVLDSK